MGAPDELDGIETPCPTCGRLIKTSVQFKVGSCYLKHHRLGDKITWGNEGIIYSPEAKGKDRFEVPVAIMACLDCVGRYAWQYRALRRELEKAGRLEFLDEPPAEASNHPEPNQQDGVVLIDGIYPAWAWIRFELERLGAPVADSLETWEGTLVIKNDVLSEVLPAKKRSIPRRLSTAALLSDCLYEELALKPMSREIRSPQVALEEISERQRMLCRRVEHAPEHDPLPNVYINRMKLPSPPGLPIAQDIERRIIPFRGHRVMLDHDLAEIYGVSTWHLNQAVKRNRERFPEDFSFQLNHGEAAFLTSQIVMSKPSRGGRRTLPYVFTEHGAVMLACVLRSSIAVAASIHIVRAFNRLRLVASAHKDLTHALSEITRKVAGHDEKFDAVFAVLRRLMNPPANPRRKIGFTP